MNLSIGTRVKRLVLNKDQPTWQKHSNQAKGTWQAGTIIDVDTEPLTHQYTVNWGVGRIEQELTHLDFTVIK